MALFICTRPTCRAMYTMDMPDIIAKGIRGDTGEEFTWALGKGETTCPRCGGVAKMTQGTYSFDENGVVSLLSGPEVTPDILERLKVLALASFAKPEDAANFKEQANAIVPTLGDRFEKYMGEKKNTMDFLKLLLTILSTMLGGMAYMRGKPAPAAPTIINNNTYNYSVINPILARQAEDLRRLQGRPAAPHGSNSTPPKKKKPRRK
jgi:hypothetical protein